MTDEETEWIRQAQAGDRRAFAALLEARYDTMFRMALRWCGNRQDAEDITQTACIKLARALPSYRFQAAFTSWLYRLVVNTAIDWKKMQRRHERGHESLPAETELPAAGGDAARDLETRQDLARVLALPEREKTALLLVFGEGLSHAEAAFVMACRESTVSWYIHEARRKLGAGKGGKERSHG